MDNHCYYIINLYTKEKISCNKDDVHDEILYIKNNLRLLDKNIIYLFKFDKSMYYVVNSKTPFIKLATDVNTFKFLWAIYNKVKDREHLINDIIKNIDSLPPKIMLNIHPQRWHDSALPWVKELIGQNVKNVGKFILAKSRK